MIYSYAAAVHAHVLSCWRHIYAHACAELCSCLVIIMTTCTWQ